MVPHWWNLPDPPSRVPDKPPTARWLTPSNVPGAAGSLRALLPRLLTEPDLWACRGKHPEGPDPLSQGRKKGEPRAAGRCTKDKLETSAGTSSQRPFTKHESSAGLVPPLPLPHFTAQEVAAVRLAAYPGWFWSLHSSTAPGLLRGVPRLAAEALPWAGLLFCC